MLQAKMNRRSNAPERTAPPQEILLCFFGSSPMLRGKNSVLNKLVTQTHHPHLTLTLMTLVTPLLGKHAFRHQPLQCPAVLPMATWYNRLQNLSVGLLPCPDPDDPSPVARSKVLTSRGVSPKLLLVGFSVVLIGMAVTCAVIYVFKMKSVKETNDLNLTDTLKKMEDQKKSYENLSDMKDKELTDVKTKLVEEQNKSSELSERKTALERELSETKKTHEEQKKELAVLIKDKADLTCHQLASVNVTLDPDTAHPRLNLSEDGKQVRLGDKQQNLPDNPKRFSIYPMVLGKEGFSSGRFYYEVQVKDKTGWSLGVVRESINRKGDITPSPDNGYWIVRLMDGEYKALAGPPVLLSLSQKPQMVGVFVDYEGGQVSFYDVDNRSHIYSFTGITFTEKLYPFFSPCVNSDGKNSAPLVITPVN